ncbi:hypothetical protein EDB80DRAFT_877163 [Ilyonectria destructans]|nr:hypothetical protein EDB80DRAFT_877163 [Ilyonectria destructans]
MDSLPYSSLSPTTSSAITGIPSALAPAFPHLKMRLLASIPALLALSGTVTAAPVTANKPSEAELKAIWAQGLNVTEQTEPIPASMILEPGAVDIFGQSPARDTDNPLLAKRIYDRGNCFEWASWVSANSRQAYTNDFQSAKAIFQGYDRWGWNYIGPQQQFNWGWGSFKITIRNQDVCSRGYFTWDDVLDMMDDLWYHFCQNRAQGWGYMQWNPDLVAMIYFDGSPMPGYQPGCNHTELKKLLKAKREAEEAEEAEEATE